MSYRNELLTMRLSVEEMDALRARARASGVTLANVVRAALGLEVVRRGAPSSGPRKTE